MQGCIDVRNIRPTNIWDWIPKLADGLGLTWSEKREVRLIVGINASHQLDIRSIGVRQVAVPGIAKLLVTPRPLLLARSNVVVRYMHHAGLQSMIDRKSVV